MDFKEKVIEKIIDLINVGASGRLIISKVENSDKDLKIEKRADYKAHPGYIKIFCQEKSFNEDFLKETLGNDLPEEPHIYLLFVFFDFLKQDIEERMVVIPAENLKKAKADFSSFVLNKKNLGTFFVDVLDRKP